MNRRRRRRRNLLEITLTTSKRKLTGIRGVHSFDTGEASVSLHDLEVRAFDAVAGVVGPLVEALVDLEVVELVFVAEYESDAVVVKIVDIHLHHEIGKGRSLVEGCAADALDAAFGVGGLVEEGSVAEIRDDPVADAPGDGRVGYEFPGSQARRVDDRGADRVLADLNFAS